MSPVRNHGRETLLLSFELENHREGSCATACRKESRYLVASRFAGAATHAVCQQSQSSEGSRCSPSVQTGKPLPNRNNAGRFGRGCVGTTRVHQAPRKRHAVSPSKNHSRWKLSRPFVGRENHNPLLVNSDFSTITLGEFTRWHARSPSPLRTRTPHSFCVPAIRDQEL